MQQFPKGAESQRLLRDQAYRQLQQARRKQARRAQRRQTVTVAQVTSDDVYLPPAYLPNPPRTYGTHEPMTVLRCGSALGIEVAF